MPSKRASANRKAKLSFEESAAAEAQAGVQSARAADLAAAAAASKQQNNVSNKGKTSSKSATSPAAKRVSFAGVPREREDDDDAESSDGKARSRKKPRRETATSQEEEEEDVSFESDSDDDEEESDAASQEENLSDVADGSSDDDDDMDAESDSEENPFVKAHRDGTQLSYPALRLRFLPPEFQEPELYKFLGQFGAKVLNCFCVRSRRTHQSKGIAYVQFDSPSVLPTAVEECHGMSLGGRAVQARQVLLHRPMPTKERVLQRRRLAMAYAARGAPLRRHSVAHKDPVAVLIKAARTERENNKQLRRLGVDYQSDFFISQLRAVPADRYLNKKKKSNKKGGESKKEAAAAPKAEAASPAPRASVKTNNNKNSATAAAGANSDRESPRKKASSVDTDAPTSPTPTRLSAHSVASPAAVPPPRTTTPKKAATGDAKAAAASPKGKSASASASAPRAETRNPSQAKRDSSIVFDTPQSTIKRGKPGNSTSKTPRGNSK